MIGSSVLETGSDHRKSDFLDSRPGLQIPGQALTRGNDESDIASLLIPFQPRVPDHFRPLRGFVAYLLRELLRRVAYRDAAVLGDARDDVGLIQHGDGFAVP